ncbi:MAG: hypothetical protein WAK91_00540 [Candidatus Acidiferrales bacterium]|jgi:UDP-N-acetylmuramyl pentapeptide phosphotransferase/UDP-N-acetylglucosamine-1-phosphate transferase
MRPATLIAIVLVAIGIISLGYQGITYTTQKKVVDIGPIQATKQEHKTIPLPPIVGVIALIGGVVVLATERRTS